MFGRDVPLEKNTNEQYNYVMFIENGFQSQIVMNLYVVTKLFKPTRSEMRHLLTKVNYYR
ncbi:hypothetical protein BLOT_007487 [Blomia tropicalis]|nr:hypothetical protein BLOT_007487 [Blomia tropicalis]